MENNFGFSIDSTIKVNYDSTIRTKPVDPLTEEEREYLYKNSFSYFYNYFKYRHFRGRCLEKSEYQEYYSDKDFMKARAFVFFNRTISIFDKSVYDGPAIGLISDEESKKGVTPYEVNCLLRFALTSRNEEGAHFYKGHFLGNNEEEILSTLQQNDELSQQIKKLVAITRLSVYWHSRYKFYIGRLIAEIVRDKQKRSKPLKREKGTRKEHLKSYNESMKGAEDLPQDQDIDFNFVNKESSEHRIYDLFMSGELSDLPFQVKRYLFCSYYLEMSNTELILEFGDSLASIKKELERRV